MSGIVGPYWNLFKSIYRLPPKDKIPTANSKKKNTYPTQLVDRIEGEGIFKCKATV